MRRQPRRDTRPEVELRRQLHHLGLRFRVDRQVLAAGRRRADVVFGPSKVAVFVDGCYWHRCPQHGTLPKTNTQWWSDKLDRNVQRDRDTDQALAQANWLTIRVWEHEDMPRAALNILETVNARRPTVGTARNVHQHATDLTPRFRGTPGTRHGCSM